MSDVMTPATSGSGWLPDGKVPTEAQLRERYGEWLTAAHVAEVAGVKPETWRRYVATAAARAPKPDQHLSRTPVWSPRTVAAWLASRPGPGRVGTRTPDEGS